MMRKFFVCYEDHDNKLYHKIVKVTVITALKKTTNDILKKFVQAYNSSMKHLNELDINDVHLALEQSNDYLSLPSDIPIGSCIDGHSKVYVRHGAAKKQADIMAEVANKANSTTHTCARYGCTNVHVENERFGPCVFHKSPPVFKNDGMYWACCPQKKVTCFDDLIKIRGCEAASLCTLDEEMFLREVSEARLLADQQKAFAERMCGEADFRHFPMYPGYGFHPNMFPQSYAYNSMPWGYYPNTNTPQFHPYYLLQGSETATSSSPKEIISRDIREVDDDVKSIPSNASSKGTKHQALSVTPMKVEGNDEDTKSNISKDDKLKEISEVTDKEKERVNDGKNVVEEESRDDNLQSQNSWLGNDLDGAVNDLKRSSLVQFRRVLKSFGVDGYLYDHFLADMKKDCTEDELKESVKQELGRMLEGGFKAEKRLREMRKQKVLKE